MQNKRVMLKLSGEALAKSEGGYNEDKVRDIAKQLKPSLAAGTNIGIVIFVVPIVFLVYSGMRQG